MFKFFLKGQSALLANHKEYFYDILPHISVFARVAPKQKEQVIVVLKSLGYCTLMCGDGTNDVGALKHADVGVAIISNAPEKVPDRRRDREKEKEKERERERIRLLAQNQARHERGMISNSEHFQKLLKELEEQDQPQVVKLGDASIAAPFTSKLSSIQCSKCWKHKQIK